MIKKILLSTSIVGALMLSGCSQSGIGINSGSSTMKQSFEVGVVVNTQKVLIDKGSLASVGTGALIGATGGAILGSRSSSKNALKGGVIGTAVGAGGGYIYNTVTKSGEIEAYEIEIENYKGRIFRTYVEYDLRIGQVVEFIERADGTITNIDIKEKGKRVN